MCVFSVFPSYNLLLTSMWWSIPWWHIFDSIFVVKYTQRIVDYSTRPGLLLSRGMPTKKKKNIPFQFTPVLYIFFHSS